MSHLLRRHYGGWRPSRPDPARKLKLYTRYFATGEPLPTKTMNRVNDATIYDQGEEGSCTANMGCGLFNYELIHQGLQPKLLSRQALYYWTRVREGTQDYDAGATISDTFETMAYTGVPPEEDWPYSSPLDQEPTSAAVANALQNRELRSRVLDNAQLDMLKDCLAAGFGFGFGFTVQDSFESDEIAASGLMPAPLPDERVLGGHAIRAVDYDDSILCPNAKPGAVICANSWGDEWGFQPEGAASRGYFAMPYEVITNLDIASDFRSMELVSPG